MSLALAPVGAVVERRYYSLPTHYTIGDTFETWDEVVTEARKRFEAAVEVFVAQGTAPTREGCENVAREAVQVSLRWFLSYPEGGGMDVEIERWRDITKLRTSVEVG